MQRRFFQRFAIPLVFAIFWLIIAVSFAFLILQLRTRILTVRTAGDAETAIQLITQRVQAAQDVVNTVAIFAGTEDNGTNEKLQTLTEQLFWQAPELFAIQLIDSQDKVIESYPKALRGRETVHADAMDSLTWSDALIKAKETGQNTLSEPLLLTHNKPGFLILSPIFRHGDYYGSIVGAVELEPLLSSTWLNAADGVIHFKTEAIQVMEAGRRIYTTEGFEVLNPNGDLGSKRHFPQPLSEPSENKRIRLGDAVWTLSLSPSPATRREIALEAMGLFAIISLFALMSFVFISRLIKQHEELQVALKREDDLVSITSHQLREPVMESAAYLDLLSEELPAPLPKTLKTYLETLKTINRSNAQMISNLLGVSRLERGTLKANVKPIAAKTIVNDALQRLRSAIQTSNARVEVKDAGLQSRLLADPVLAVEVLQNIIDNAIKYSPAGELITISCEARKQPSHVIIRVNDKGPGIAEDIQSNIFTRSTTTTKNGAGLGLYISKKFMDAMGGEITFETSPTGTTFLLAFKKATTKTGRTD